MKPGLELVHRQQSGHKRSRAVYLVCVFRDERLLLEYFIKYYLSLGVTHFIMLDNLSKDGGPEYLTSLDNINLWLYSTDDNYRNAALGTDWVNDLMREHCIGQYCFTVDADELFVFDHERYSSLNQLIEDMEFNQANAVPATLLDMYPKSTNDNDYQRGEDFLQHSSYFDGLNDEFYEDRGSIYEHFQHKVGGVRRRVFGVTVCIHKFPLIKYDFYPLGVAVGYHFFQRDGIVLRQSAQIRLHSQPCVLMHFKFIKPDLVEFYKDRANDNREYPTVKASSVRAISSWASENESYLQLFGQGTGTRFYDPEFSESLNEWRDLSRFFSVT